MPIPRYFVREKMRALKEREKMLAHILAKGGCQEHKAVSVSWCKTHKWNIFFSQYKNMQCKKFWLLIQQVLVQSMSMERAVWLLQVSERARQGRLRAHFMKTIRQEEQRRLQGSSSSMLDPDQAATCIQKVSGNHLILNSEFAFQWNHWSIAWMGWQNNEENFHAVKL